MADTKPTRTIVNKYSVGIFLGVLLLVGGLYTVTIFDNKIEVTLPSDVCNDALLRVTKDDFTLKCGSRIAFQADTVVDYWRTYGVNAAGEEAWWERNQRFVGINKANIKLDLIEYENSFDIVRTTRYRKGRQSIEDGTLKETYTFTKDKIKITYDYDVKNAAEHKISMRVKKQYKSYLSAFDPNGYTGSMSGNVLSYKGFGDLYIDPTVTLVSPSDNSVAYNETDTAPFICQTVNATAGETFANISLWWNADGTWKQAATEELSGTASVNTTFSLVIPHQDSAGTFVWNCYGCNSSGTCDWDANDTMNPVYAPNAINLTGPGDSNMEDLNLLDGVAEIDTMYSIYPGYINISDNGSLFINWTHPTHPDGDNMSFNLSYTGTTTPTETYFWNSGTNGTVYGALNYSALAVDDYYITVYACSEDNPSLCSSDTYATPLEIFDFAPSLSNGESEIRFSTQPTYTTGQALGQTNSKGIVQIDWDGYGAPTGTINLTLTQTTNDACASYYFANSDNVSAVAALANNTRVLLAADARTDPEYFWLWLTKASCGTTTLDTSYSFEVLE